MCWVVWPSPHSSRLLQLPMPPHSTVIQSPWTTPTNRTTGYPSRTNQPQACYEWESSSLFPVLSPPPKPIMISHLSPSEHNDRKLLLIIPLHWEQWRRAVKGWSEFAENEENRGRLWLGQRRGLGEKTRQCMIMLSQRLSCHERLYDFIRPSWVIFYVSSITRNWHKIRYHSQHWHLWYLEQWLPVVMYVIAPKPYHFTNSTDN